MEAVLAQKSPAVRDARLRELSSSLAALRLAGKADVTLMCGGREFPAHRLVLEASSPYFLALFGSGLQEAQTGRVVFRDMEPRTVEAILDFVYLGDVTKINSKDRAQKVLSAAHLLGLEGLFAFCCDALVELLTPGDFLDAWDAAAKYGHAPLLDRVLSYVVANYVAAQGSPDFAALTTVQLVELLRYAGQRLPCADELLKSILRWVGYDPQVREESVAELLECIDPLRLTKTCVRALLLDDRLLKASAAVGAQIKDVALEVLASDGGVEEQPQPLALAAAAAALKEGRPRLLLFSQCLAQEEQDTRLRRTVQREMRCSCVQQLDLHELEWLPPLKLPFNVVTGLSAAQLGRHIYLVGGVREDGLLQPLNIRYDARSNSAHYKSAGFPARTEAGLATHKERLFLVGGRGNGGELLPSVHRYDPKSDTWAEWTPLSHARASASLLIADNRLFVAGGNTEAPIAAYAEYCDIGSVFRPRHWTAVYLPRALPRAIGKYPTATASSLHVFYSLPRCAVRLQYDAHRRSWQAHPCPAGPPAIADVQSVTAPLYRHLQRTPASPLVFVASAAEGSLRLPTHIWDPNTDQWTELPPASGNREIPSSNTNTVISLYTHGL